MGNVTDTRSAILRAATKVFEAHGYAVATVDEVAREAGVSKGSVYNYFRSKQDLFMEVFAAALAPGEAAMRTLLDEDLPAAEKLQRYLEHWFDHINEYKRIGALILESWATVARKEDPQGMSRSCSAMYVVWLKMFARLAEQGVEDGDFRPGISPEAAAALIIGALDGLLVHAVMDVGVVFDRPFIEALKRGLLMVLQGKAAGDCPRE
jgi:AcrR family transcriptional regulator